MPREIIFDPEARIEFENAVAWCNEYRPGSGDELELEVHEMLDRIRENPDRFRLVGRTTRTARLQKFYKYAIYFHVESNFIGIVSVFHSSRDPAELRRRLT